jgi:hypothetical protein
MDPASRMYVIRIFTAVAGFCRFSNKITEIRCVMFRTNVKFHQSLNSFLDLQFGNPERVFFFLVMRYCREIGRDSLIPNLFKFIVLVFLIPWYSKLFCTCCHNVKWNEEESKARKFLLLEIMQHSYRTFYSFSAGQNFPPYEIKWFVWLLFSRFLWSLHKDCCSIAVRI